MEDGAITRGRYSQVQEALEAFIKGLPRGEHLTAPEVYKRAKEKGLKVSLSTVYRTLNALSEQGQVQALSGEHGRRYEAADGTHEHDHLICVKCSLTIEFEDELIRGFGKTVADRKGYEYRHSRFDILGTCQQCRLQGEDHQIELSLTHLEKAATFCSSSSQKILQAIEQLKSKKLNRAKELMESVQAHLQDAFKEIENAIEASLEKADDDYS